MKKLMPVLILGLLFAGGCEKKEAPVMTVGSIEISKKEFQQALKRAELKVQDNKVDKQEFAAFLDSLATRKLLLKEAETMGLDKNEQLLEGLQMYWEQALIKLLISQKSRELSATIGVSDSEITNYYNQNKDREFAGKELPEVYSQIKWLLNNQKQAKALQDWVASLKAKTKVQVHFDRLGVKQK